MKRSIAILLFGLTLAAACVAQEEPRKTGTAGAAQPAERTPAVVNPVGGGKDEAPTMDVGPIKTSQPAESPEPVKPTPMAQATALRASTLSVAEIMKRNRAAMGMSLTDAKITSTVATGKIEISGLTGTVEIYSKAPDRQVSILTINGFGQVMEGFDGTEAWSQDPLSGLRLKSGVELTQAKSSSIFDRDAQLEKLYPKLVVKGMTKVNGRDAHVIDATSSTGAAETWYFDAESFLLVKQDMVAESPQGKFPVETFLEDYRAVGGAKMPFTLRSVTSAQTIVVRLSEVKTNVAIDDAKFSKPKA